MLTPATGSAGALLAVVLLLSGCAATGSATSDGGPSTAGAAVPTPSVEPSETPAGDALGPGVHSIRVQGQAAVVAVPARSNGALVVYLHGYAGNASAAFQGDAFAGLATGLVEHGYTVAASDAFGDAWGSTASVDAHAALAATVQRRVPAEDVYLVAESMGGLAAARLVEGRRIAGLRGYAGIYPLCDLSSVYGDFAASIDAAYGTSVDAALDELSPVPLDAAVPVLFWASEEDTTVDKSRNADVCAAQVRADGGSAVVVETEGRHLDPSNFDLDAMLAFFESAAG